VLTRSVRPRVRLSIRVAFSLIIHSYGLAEDRPDESFRQSSIASERTCLITLSPRWLLQLLVGLLLVLRRIKNDDKSRNCDNDERDRATPTRVDYSLRCIQRDAQKNRGKLATLSTDVNLDGILVGSRDGCRRLGRKRGVGSIGEEPGDRARRPPKN